jgi:hypothetical protein
MAPTICPEFRVDVQRVAATYDGSMERPDYTPEVATFVDQARQFCDFVENGPQGSLSKRLVDTRERLLALYAAGCKLPAVQPPEGIKDSPDPKPVATPPFGTFDTYWEVFDPYVADEPVAGSLSDELAEIYADVQRGLALWDRDVPRAAAIWEWRFHFDRHWGDHAVDVLRALHRACGRA